jgi:WD40 repeat protein
MVTLVDLDRFQNLVKAVTIMPDKGMLAVSSDKLITLFDLNTQSFIRSLKGHKEEIRCLLSNKDILFSAGKGNL